MLLGKVNRVLGALYPALETWSSERERRERSVRCQEREREREGKRERGRENLPFGEVIP